MIVIDVWAGHNSQDHVARFFRPMTEALAIAERELSAGHLINLRQELAWGSTREFDTRRQH